MLELLEILSNDLPVLYYIFQICFLMLGALFFLFINEIFKISFPVFYKRMMWPFFSKQYIEEANIKKEDSAILNVNVSHKKLVRLPNSGDKCFRIDSDVYIAFKWKDRKLKHVYVSGLADVAILNNIKIT